MDKLHQLFGPHICAFLGVLNVHKNEDLGDDEQCATLYRLLRRPSKKINHRTQHFIH